MVIKYFYSPPITIITTIRSDNNNINSKPIVIESDNAEEVISPRIAIKKRKYTNLINLTKAKRIVKVRFITIIK